MKKLSNGIYFFVPYTGGFTKPVHIIYDAIHIQEFPFLILCYLHEYIGGEQGLKNDLFTVAPLTKGFVKRAILFITLFLE